MVGRAAATTSTSKTYGDSAANGSFEKIEWVVRSATLSARVAGSRRVDQSGDWRSRKGWGVESVVLSGRLQRPGDDSEPDARAWRSSASPIPVSECGRTQRGRATLARPSGPPPELGYARRQPPEEAHRAGPNLVVSRLQVTSGQTSQALVGLGPDDATTRLGCLPPAIRSAVKVARTVGGSRSR
jgi:hypothetical protein